MNNQGISVGDVVVSHGYGEVGIVTKLRPSLNPNNKIATLSILPNGSVLSDRNINTCYLQKLTPELMDVVEAAWIRQLHEKIHEIRKHVKLI